MWTPGLLAGRHGRRSDAFRSAQGFADVDPWLDGTLRFGGGYSTWSPPSSPVMAEVRQMRHCRAGTGSVHAEAFRLMLALHCCGPRCLEPDIAGD